MTAKHTPGPWEARKIRGYRITTTAYKGTFVDPYVCTVDGIDGKNEANARLIAAAPELLQALVAIVKEYKNDIHNCVDSTVSEENILAAEIAIAKAEGNQ